MNNELIPTNGLWYKIKKIFKKIFSWNKSYNKELQNVKEIDTKNQFKENLKEDFENNNRREILAKKLLCGEIGASDLEETEVEEMTQYFTNDIQKIDNELLRIKKHILIMQQQLTNQS